MSSFSSVSNITTEINARINSNGSLILGIYDNDQKLITSKEYRFTIAIADIIISEVLFLNFPQKPRFDKVLELERNVSKT